MSGSRDMRQLSRDGWTTESRTLEAINCGSILRIADAVEKVAVRHTELMADRDRFKRWYEQEQAQCSQLALQVRALKGQITKLKKAAATPKETT